MTPRRGRRRPAKLTLSLRITGVRADGYHLLDAEMVTLDLADALTITPGGDGHHGRRAVRRRRPDRRLEPRRQGARRRRSPGGGAHRQADPPRRRARRRLGRRRRRAALGRPRRPRRGRRGSAPTCRSASSAGGPGCAGIGEVVEPLPVRAADRDAGRAAAARQHAGRLPGLGRARRADGGRRQRPRAGGARRRAGAGDVARPHRASWPATRRRWPAAGRRGSCPASATTPSPPCGARALRWSWPARSGRARARRRRACYLRRWWRVRRSIFLCFFLRIRLRRFLISEPIRPAGYRRIGTCAIP